MRTLSSPTSLFSLGVFGRTTSEERREVLAQSRKAAKTEGRDALSRTSSLGARSAREHGRRHCERASPGDPQRTKTAIAMSSFAVGACERAIEPTTRRLRQLATDVVPFARGRAVVVGHGDGTIDSHPVSSAATVSFSLGVFASLREPLQRRGQKFSRKAAKPQRRRAATRRRGRRHPGSFGEGAWAPPLRTVLTRRSSPHQEIHHAPRAS